MKKVLVQLKRLKRHYEHSVKTYDDASLLDLSHSLRIWTELKLYLSETYPEFQNKKTFKTGSPIRKIVKQANKYEYIFSYLPKDGVTTFANKGNIVSGNKDGDMTIGASFMMKEKSMILNNYFYVSKSLGQSFIKLAPNHNTTRVNYSNWLSSEIVRLQFINSDGSLEKYNISREMLVKRVANILDGSHSSLANNDDYDNRFDEPIKWLMDFDCGGLPLPYFMLLKVSQDILEFVPPLLGIKSETNQ